MNESELTGRAKSHIVQLDELAVGLHYEAVASVLAMRDAARRDGIDLAVRSAFRDFDTQLAIWNAKWAGRRPLLSRAGQLLQRQTIADADMVDIILNWSAIPGGSRHHWGSEIDVVDRRAVPDGYQVRLVPEEFSADGIFACLAGWLADNSARFGFFRPYRTDRGGVMAEPWHLSYWPISLPALESLSLATLRNTLSDAAMEGKQFVLERLPEIYTRYLLNIDAP